MKYKCLNKKGQVGNVETLVFGVSTLIIAIIIALIVVSAVTDSNLLSDSRKTVTVTNESQLTGHLTWVNRTGYGLYYSNNTNTDFSVKAVWVEYNSTAGPYRFWNCTNSTPTGYNVSLDAANYSFNADQVNITNSSTSWWFCNASITYTYRPFSSEEMTVNYSSGNLTSGVNKVSEKIPTLLLVAAIILVLSVLAILIGVWQKMRGNQI
jgi:hypothetical protein